MRLPVIVSACGLAATLAPAVHADPSLAARGFGLSPWAVPVVPVPGTPPPASLPVRVPRVRPTDRRITTILANGLSRSLRLRQLVEQVEAGNVVAYVSLDARMDDGLSGRLVLSGAAGEYRYVRVLLNPDQNGAQIIAALAHELQHVIEIGEHPEVTSEATLSALYERIGHSNRASGLIGWETAAAQEVGAAVRRELTLGAGALARRGTEDSGRSRPF